MKRILVLLFVFYFIVNNLKAEVSAPDTTYKNVAAKLHYQPVPDGYQITGSNNIFNRVLYGGHGNDILTEKYLTFAGDQPIILGTLTDWRKTPACLQAKCGTFMAGVALTPGISAPVFNTPADRGERYSQWFHQNEGTVATYRNGWMEYEINTFAQCFPRVTAKIEVLPITTENGYLVHFKINTDQRIIFVMGLGGITDFLGRFEFPYVTEREFAPADCIGNEIKIEKDRAVIIGANGQEVNTSMQVGASFPVNYTIGDAEKVAYPGSFLSEDDTTVDAPMVKMDCEIKQGKTLDGYIVVLRDPSKEAMDKWLAHPNPVDCLKNEIRKVTSALNISTPDKMLDLSLPPNVLAMDASWHEKSFYHGAYAWHAPYLGWRNWYGPTVMGWHDRVKTSFKTFAEIQPSKTERQEEVIFNGPSQYSRLKDSYGFLPDINNGKSHIFYNMQEVGIDMILHEIEWTGDLAYAKQVFDNISGVLDWEERILDPDNDNLYQNWLNTWISDAHSYNGGGCAQSSAYNYRANMTMAKLASKLGRDPKPFLERSEEIRKAVQGTLWVAEKGVMAEYIDIIGNKLLHTSPELATIYHSIEAGIVDQFQAYQMLSFTENVLRNETTKARGGRLVWSSDWYPQNYSSCGLYTAENIHLAWAYFMCGQTQKGNELLKGLVDAHFLSRLPGVVAHCLAPDGHSDGSTDFTDVNSMYLRLVVEGLFGIRFNLLDEKILIAPNFPKGWENACLEIADGSLSYQRDGENEKFNFNSEAKANKVFSIPLRSSKVESVRLNGQPAEYRIEPGIGYSKLVVESQQKEIDLKINYSQDIVPNPICQKNILNEGDITIEVNKGNIIEIKDPSSCLNKIKRDKKSVEGKMIGTPGNHTVFVRVKNNDWDAWLPVELSVKEQKQFVKPLTNAHQSYKPVDISGNFNISLTDIHKQEYWDPRPKGYSIMTRLDGRFGWDWNHAGKNKVIVDDSKLRSSGGNYTTGEGIPFITPEKGANVACVSMWENFPEEMSFELSGSGSELAVFFIGATNPMQSRVENARFIVEYTDGTKEKVSLVNPENFDDWLVAAVQQENETEYFSNFNHGIVQRIMLDPDKKLKRLKVRAIANEVIVGILGVSICR